MRRKTVIVLIIIILSAIFYYLISQIVGALKSSDRLSQAADQVYQLEAKNRQLKEELKKIQSPEYIEEQLRDKLGLSKKGETVVVIPEKKIKEVLGASESSQEVRLPNWLGWLRVFFR
ncbi:MAG: septum formation initiator family protein [Candidatus Daviesbacteria bacterium]|nr:septum formation initiator family protein [Candidatus Daviesbacteria bacterium]